MGPFRLTHQEARTLTALLLILLAGIAGMLVFRGTEKSGNPLLDAENALPPLGD